MKNWNLNTGPSTTQGFAIGALSGWWKQAESMGWYLALTGSCLYDGYSNNDIDVIFYRKEGVPQTPPKETMKLLGTKEVDHVSDDDYADTCEDSPQDGTLCNYYGDYQGIKFNCFFMRFMSEKEVAQPFAPKVKPPLNLNL